MLGSRFLDKISSYVLAVSLLAAIGAVNVAHAQPVTSTTSDPSIRNSAKGNVLPGQWPEPIKNYINDNYPGYTVVVSRKKSNGQYFVKIRYGHDGSSNGRHRSLVFGADGSVIKG